MKSLSTGPLNEPLDLIFPFDNMPDGALLVDIGGGSGHRAIQLASAFPQLSCVVQDHSSVTQAASKAAVLPEHVAGRISWESHDYRLPQLRKGARYYLFSRVLMDNTDAYVCLF